MASRRDISYGLKTVPTLPSNLAATINSLSKPAEFGNRSNADSLARILQIKSQNEELRKVIKDLKSFFANDIRIPPAGSFDSEPSIKEDEKKPSIDNIKEMSSTVGDVNKVGDNKENPVKEKKTSTKASKKGAAPADEAVDIGRLDLRIGKIVSVEKHPDADTLYVEKVDVGEENPRTILSGLVKYVSLEQMEGRLGVFLCNLKPVKMRGILSEGMLMCASTPENVEILIPPVGSVPGDYITVEGFVRNPDPVLNPKKKVFETVAVDLKTDENKVATYKNIPLTVAGKGNVVAPTLVNVIIK